ncbi:receptor-like protein 12 isoform X2 [Amaranthus tricolor]|uniref:receptor-like protein 12 isoform X2 n=1 Tax=Amaranthus tricolor TaxID=29722 RepID=UPI00258407D6|nr:receptor-like protein 12 isoform X2 [Amaranthus tricolor]
MRIIVFFLFINFLNISFINGGILSEQEALLAIKSAIKDDPHKSLSSWKNTTHHCNWSFITCSSSSHFPTVISLDISNLDLNGTLSPQIGFLTNLQNLSLLFNNFYGHVPSSLTLLTKLQYLDLELNQFSGPLPLFVNMSELRCLSLSGNDFSGTISSEFSKLQKLQVLDLSSNNLSGLLPYKLGFLKRFKILDLSNNQLHGYNITNFKNYSICNLVDLEILDLSYNKFNGEVPHCLGNTSTKLVVLNLQSNNFKGIIPSTFSTCDLLEYVDFTENQLEGAIPRSLSKCRNLKVLNLRNNKFKDVFPYWLGSLPYLEVLSLPFNKFHGDITNNLSKIATFSFSNLQILDLSNNNFCGKLPFIYIKQFRSMMDINMSTIGSPRYLENEFGNYMYSIKMIVKGNQLDYKKIITSMSTFDMSNNHFEGEIPNSIGMLRALRNLNLSHNLLTGNIPPSIKNLSLLDGLDLSSNRLIGEIPQELVSLTFLEVFNVSYNQLEGPIPHGNNFDTFSSDSYEGNLELCGVPLLECKNNTVVQSLNNDNVEEKTELSMWEVVVIGFGSGTIVGLAWGYYILSVGKPFWLFKLLNKMEWALLDFHDHLFSRRSRTRRTKN